MIHFKHGIRKSVSLLSAVSVLLGTGMTAASDNSNGIETKKEKDITYVTGISANDVTNGVVTIPDSLGDRIFNT